MYVPYVLSPSQNQPCRCAVFSRPQHLSASTSAVTLRDESRLGEQTALLLLDLVADLDLDRELGSVL